MERKFKFEIQNQRAIELEALRERYLATREEQVRYLGERLREVEAELATRKVSELSRPRLVALSESLRSQLSARDRGEMHFSTPVQFIPADKYQEEAQDWVP